MTRTQEETEGLQAEKVDRARIRALHPYVGPAWDLRATRGGSRKGAMSPIAARIAQSLPPLEARLRARAIEAVAERITAERAITPEPPTPQALIGALARVASAAVGAIDRAESAMEELVPAYQKATTPADRRAVLALYLKRSGEGVVQTTRDAAATRRWLDLEAVRERAAAEIADRIDEIEVAYRAIAGQALELDPRAEATPALGDAGVIPLALEHAAPGRPAAIRVAALRAAAALMAAFSPSDRLRLTGVPGARAIVGWTRGVGASRWVQIAALELCALLFPDDAVSAIAERLEAPCGRATRPAPDDMIVRRNALCILEGLMTSPEALRVARIAASDPSEHVRQELARLLASARGAASLETFCELARGDASPRVRGVAVLELAKRASNDPEARPAAEGLLADLLACGDTLVTRATLAAIRALCVGPSAVCSPEVFVRPLADLLAHADTPPAVLDDAGATLRLLEVEASPVLTDLRDALKVALDRLGEGESAPIRMPEGALLRDIERALAAAARGDLCVALRYRGGGLYTLTRGEPRRLRLWRLLHEIRTPMPDKRKGFVHTRARVCTGEIVVPPAGMAEVTPTRVPGERQWSAAAQSWGPFLPRVDDLLATCALVPPDPLRLVTTMGTVKLRGPATLAGRLRARARLSIGYERFAESRRRSLDGGDADEQRRFTTEARALGFSMEIDDVAGEIGRSCFVVRPSLPAKYFAALVPFGIPSWTEHALAYMLSPSGNTPTHLAFIVWFIFAALLLRAAWIMQSIQRARAAIPLTIGGWGTRGKSGTERLKAALFHALRYDVVVKTTGCEAMIIHAMRDLPAQEIFLYRPYDKATIWEQSTVLHAANRLGAQVFLWECMALQPRFVETLESEWMRDPITTITNAYPDHEDIQGPSGEDVARVIARFMPEGGRALTSEEQMLPLLRDAAREKGAELTSVPPLVADLLPADLLARMPYQEHPRNIALVLSLAEHLGIDREFALVEMADFVVPDLGVLQTYPTVTHRGRSLTFSNGMSANERAGFLSNWTRLGFDKPNADGDPRRVTVMLINNRADRVARSRVFAQIVVDDIGVDHVVLINSNLGGMMQFIEDALDTRLRETRVAGGASADRPEGAAQGEETAREEQAVRALRKLDEALGRAGVPTRDDALFEGVLGMLRALPLDEAEARKVMESAEVAAALKAPSSELGAVVGAALEKALGAASGVSGDLRADVVRHAGRLGERIGVRDALRAEVRAAVLRGAAEEANEAFRKACKALFMGRVSVLWDVAATGDQVIDFMTREIPPGAVARVMGAQNIKGTGLDFVYRWVSIGRVRASLTRMQESAVARAGELSWLLSYSDLGLIDCREALAFLREVQASGDPGWSAHAGLVGSAVRRLEAMEVQLSARLVSTGRAGLGVRLAGQVERMVDHLDSKRRTRAADRIMADLFARRIGHSRAALLMRDVVGRTKGGWLAKDIGGIYKRVRARVSAGVGAGVRAGALASASVKERAAHSLAEGSTAEGLPRPEPQ